MAERSWNHILINNRAYTSRDGVTPGDELARVDPEVELEALSPGDFVVIGRTLMARVQHTLADGVVVCVLAKASAGRKARAIQL